MSTLEEIRGHLEDQLYELEALQAVYPEELKIVDHGILADINEFITRTRDVIPQKLEYSIAINTPEGSVDLQVNLPLDYPVNHPEVYVRSSLDRQQQNRLNEALTTYVEIQEPGEPFVHSLVTWLQDNLESYFKEAKDMGKKHEPNNRKKEVKQTTTTFARYWVYSHHIYSNTKRKDIVEEAKENSLSGFCLPGKPGIICIEGTIDDCEHWWQKIKVMCWHKIVLKFIEKEELCDPDLNSSRKFTNFKEISFPSSDKRNDLGQLFQYLAKHNSQHVFKELFGIEGRTAFPA